MRLLPVPDASGKPMMWINADHLVSVQVAYPATERGVAVVVELKIDGLPLLRVRHGQYADKDQAEAAFADFLQTLQAEN